jgi:uncharacterized protein with PQ loop repeat
MSQPRTRRLASGVALAAGALIAAALALSAAVNALPAAWPTGDGAVIELYTLHATSFRQLLGPYSRFGFHHPGPAMFYVLAPFYAASGHATASLSVAALAVNLAALAVVSWTIVRARAPIPLALALSALLLTFVLRLPALLTSAWNPHLPVLPLVALLAVSAAVASGDVRLIPLMVVLASFVMQSHLGLAAVSLVAAGGGLVLALFQQRPVLGRDSSLGRPLRQAAWLLALLWMLPLSEQIVHRPGNLSRIVEFFFLEGEEGRVPAAAAWRAWSYSLMGLVRPDLQLPIGHYFLPAARPWIAPAVLVAVMLLFVAAFKWWRTKDRFPFALASLAIAGAAAGYWSISGIRFEIFDHAVFWLSGVGLVVLAVAASAAFLWTHKGEGGRPPGSAIRIAAGSTLLVGAAVIGVGNITEPPPPPGSADGAVRAFVDGITRALPEHNIQKPLLQVDGQAWEVMAGVLLQFAKAGVPMAVDRRLVDIFDRPWLPTGDEDATLTFADRAGHSRQASRPGNVLIAEYGGYFVDALVP